MKIIKAGFAALALSLCYPAFAEDNNTALKADVIRSEPYSDAKSVAKLSVNEKVEILSQERGWLNIKSTNGSGWVRMLSIRKGNAKKGDGDLQGVLSVASGRAGTGKIVGTTGIRGLSEEELKAAVFNGEEIKLAESFATSRTDADLFANKGALVAQKFDYLPAPAKDVQHE